MKIALLKRKILNAGALCISFLKLIPDWFRLNKKSLVIDCGANVGHISKLLASTGAEVIAFEPEPITFDKLFQRCGKKKNIKLIRKGVWDKNAVIQFYSHQESTGSESCYTVGSSIIAEKINVSTEKTQSIEVIDLVEFMRQQNRKIDLIKLDVEGAEIDILHRIIATKTWNLFEKMYVETHETKIPSHKKELRLIKEKLKEKRISNIKLNWI